MTTLATASAARQACAVAMRQISEVSAAARNQQARRGWHIYSLPMTLNSICANVQASHSRSNSQRSTRIGERVARMGLLHLNSNRTCSLAHLRCICTMLAHPCAVQRLALPPALPSRALPMPNVGTFWRMPGVAAEAAAALMLASFSMNPALAAERILASDPQQWSGMLASA